MRCEAWDRIDPVRFKTDCTTWEIDEDDDDAIMGVGFEGVFELVFVLEVEAVTAAEAAAAEEVGGWTKLWLAAAIELAVG